MTPVPLPDSKSTLRLLMRQRRDVLAQRAQRSVAICARLTAQDAYQRARSLHCYLPIRSEVDTLPLVRQALAEGKRVAVPVVVPNAPQLAHTWLHADALETLVTGVFGTWQPVAVDPCDPAECELCVVPLLAFDRACRRLGYGKGHYDRLLAAFALSPVGVAFAVQEVATLPVEPHDIPLDAIITEDEVITRRGYDV